MQPTQQAAVHLQNEGPRAPDLATRETRLLGNQKEAREQARRPGCMLCGYQSGVFLAACYARWVLVYAVSCSRSSTLGSEHALVE